MSTPDWKRLGRMIRVARIAAGYGTLEEFAAAVDLSTRILGDIEAGRRESYRDSTLLRVESVAGWAPHSWERVLAGGEPELLPREQPQDRRGAGVAPVAYGIDPDVLVELATATPEQVRRVHDYLLGLKAGGKSGGDEQKRHA